MFKPAAGAGQEFPETQGQVMLSHLMVWAARIALSLVSHGSLMGRA
jgi:hypothetical protein